MGTMLVILGPLLLTPPNTATPDLHSGPLPFDYADTRSGLGTPQVKAKIVRTKEGGLKLLKPNSRYRHTGWSQHWVGDRIIKSWGSQGRVNESWGEVWEYRFDPKTNVYRRVRQLRP